MFGNRYRYLFIAGLSVFTYLSTELCRVYYYFQIRIEWYYAFVTILLITLFTWELNRLLEPVVKKYVSRILPGLRWLLFFFVAGCLITTTITSLIVLNVGMVLKNYPLSECLEPLKLNLIYAWLANLLFHLINIIVYYISQYNYKLIEANHLKQMSIQAELQIVRNQVNPHFLFNNLNVLSALVLQNSAEANRFIEEFCKVYRYILTTNEKELVELGQELHFIEPYIFLLEKRFDDGLSVKITVDEPFKQLHIVPASLQILIENAIKHNVISRKHPLHIDIHGNGNDALIISNNLQPKPSVERSTGIGLQNIIKRYGLVSNREVVVSNDSTCFKVVLPLITKN